MSLSFLSLLNFFGYLSTITWLVTLATAIFLWIKGILPVLLKLGNNIAKAKIAIFAKGNEFEQLKKSITDTGLFFDKNFLKIDFRGRLLNEIIGSFITGNYQK